MAWIQFRAGRSADDSGSLRHRCRHAVSLGWQYRVFWQQPVKTGNQRFKFYFAGSLFFFRAVHLRLLIFADLFRIMPETFRNNRLLIYNFRMIRIIPKKITDNIHRIRDYRKTEPSLPDNFASVVLCTHCFHHFPSPEKALQEFWRITGKGGHFILVENSYSFFRRHAENLYLMIR